MTGVTMVWLDLTSVADGKAMSVSDVKVRGRSVSFEHAGDRLADDEFVAAHPEESLSC